MSSLPHDPVLPQLGAALDTDAIQAVFDEALRAHDGRRVTGCRVDRVKYRPRRNFTVSWLLDVQDVRGVAVSVQRAAGRFCAGGDAAPRHARHCARGASVAQRGIPALYDPKLELFAWFVPDDPKLSALGRLCDAVHAPSLAMGAPTGHVDAELIRYVPESRACARFDIRQPDATGSRRMYVKVDLDRSGGETHALMRVLRDSPAQSEGRLVTPRSLLWQPAAGLHWQEGVDGTPLADLYPNECPPEVSARVGRLIAALHATWAPLSRRIEGAQLHREQRDYAGTLALVEPDWGAQLSLLLSELADGVGKMSPAPHVTLHGDLNQRNILADGDRLALIDLDNCLGGAAEMELGAWIASAIDRAVAAGRELAPVQESAASMLSAYRECAEQSVSAQHIAWAVAHALLCVRAYRSVANLHRGSFSRVPALLALARFILRHGVEGRPLPIQ